MAEAVLDNEEFKRVVGNSAPAAVPRMPRHKLSEESKQAALERKFIIERMMENPPAPKKTRKPRQQRFPAGFLSGYGQSDSLSQSLRFAGSSLQYASMISREGFFELQSGGGSKRRLPSAGAGAAAKAESAPSTADAALVDESKKAAAMISAAVGSAGPMYNVGKKRKRAPRAKAKGQKANRAKKKPRKSDFSDEKQTATMQTDSDSHSSAAHGDSSAAHGDTGGGKDAKEDNGVGLGLELNADTTEQKANLFHDIDPATDFCANCSTPVLPGEPAMQCQVCTRLVHSECGGVQSRTRTATFRCSECRAQH